LAKKSKQKFADANDSKPILHSIYLLPNHHMMNFVLEQLGVYLESAIIAHCFFSVVYLSALNWKQNRWLVLSMMSLMLPLLGIVLGEARLGLLNQYYFLDNPSFILLPYVGLYFYTLKLVGIPLKKNRIYFHFIPFVTFYILYLILGTPTPERFYEGSNPNTYSMFSIFFLCVIFSIFYSYSFFSLKLIRYNKRKYLNEFAEAPVFITLDWINWVLIINLFLVTISGIGMIFLFLLNFESMPTAWPFLFIFLICCTISFFAFRQPILYHESPLENNVNNKLDDQQIIKDKDLVSEEERKEIILRLEKYMEEEEPYLDPRIRMPTLAKALAVSPHVFSYLINKHYDMNFFSFINQYRIQYAEKLLTEENHQHFTLESIGEMSGFNSKSTFNNRFKEIKGMSPGAYKKSNV